MARSKWFWILIIVGLSALAYFGLKDEKTFSFIYGSDNLDSLKNSALNTGKSFADKTIQRAEETVKKRTKEKTFEIIQGGLKNIEDAAGNILGVDLTQDINNRNSSNEFFAYLIKINTPLSFIIKNPFSLADAKNINYQIDWGDGQKDGGELKAEQNIAMTHSWNREGEYLIHFSVESEESNYQVKISAIK